MSIACRKGNYCVIASELAAGEPKLPSSARKCKARVENQGVDQNRTLAPTHVVLGLHSNVFSHAQELYAHRHRFHPFARIAAYPGAFSFC